jgi:hypothetical protein
LYDVRPVGQFMGILEILLITNIVTLVLATYLGLRIVTLKDINESTEEQIKTMRYQWEKHWKDKHIAEKQKNVRLD